MSKNGKEIVLKFPKKRRPGAKMTFPILFGEPGEIFRGKLEVTNCDKIKKIIIKLKN